MSWRCCADGPPSMHLCKVLIKFHLFDITASQTSPHLCAQGPAPYKAQGCPFNLRKCNQSSQISSRASGNLAFQRLCLSRDPIYCQKRAWKVTETHRWQWKWRLVKKLILKPSADSPATEFIREPNLVGLEVRQRKGFLLEVFSPVPESCCGSSAGARACLSLRVDSRGWGLWTLEKPDVSTWTESASAEPSGLL